VACDLEALPAPALGELREGGYGLHVARQLLDELWANARDEPRGRKAELEELIVAAADAYLDSMPGDEIDAWPLTFGQVMKLAALGYLLWMPDVFGVRLLLGAAISACATASAGMRIPTVDFFGC